MNPVQVPRPAQEGPTGPSVGLAFVVAAVVIGAAIGVYFLTPVGAKVKESGSCKEAAEWHYEESLKATDLETVELHNLKGDSYASLHFMKADCSDWKEKR